MARFVDSLPPVERTREMKVIVLSASRPRDASRNGTLGLFHALNMLGYTTYHQRTTFQIGVRALKLQAEATRACNFGQSRRYGREDFDKWLGEFDAITDIPTHVMEDLVRAYPEARFILTVRDPERWLRSVRATLAPLYALPETFPLYLLQFFESRLWHMLDVFRVSRRVLFGGADSLGDGAAALRFYREHNERAQKLVPKDKLLVVNLDDGLGWEQICPFLGHEIPSEPYPRQNDAGQFLTMSKRALAPVTRRATIRALASLAAVVGVLAWYLVSVG